MPASDADGDGRDADRDASIVRVTIRARDGGDGGDEDERLQAASRALDAERSRSDELEQRLTSATKRSDVTGELLETIRRQLRKAEKALEQEVRRNDRRRCDNSEHPIAGLRGRYGR